MVMNQLLNPNHHGPILLPPIPDAGFNHYINPMMNQRPPMISDRDIALDTHFTATSMANENFVSASAMKSAIVKQIHIGMAMQQETIAQLYEQIIQNYGWVKSPEATASAQMMAARQFNHV
jgi:hypothetical protein